MKIKRDAIVFDVNFVAIFFSNIVTKRNPPRIPIYICYTYQPYAPFNFPKTPKGYNAKKGPEQPEP